MKKISYLLIIIYIICAGIDRINFGPNITESFLILPHLIISLLFVTFQLLFRIDSINFNWFYKQRLIFISTILFFIFLILSCFFSIDMFFSFKRLVLVFIIIGTVLLILSSLNNEELDNCLYLGSILGSVLFYLFNVLLFMHWLNLFNFNNDYMNFSPNIIEYFYPRLGGFSLDPNRGSFLIIFYTYILFINKKENIFKNIILLINIFFIFTSFSRTGILLLSISFILYFFLYSSKRNRIRSIILFVSAILILFSVTRYYSNSKIINLELAIEERLTIIGGHESSGGIHMKLINDGIDIALSDLKIFLIGCGYGASWKIIKGYFMSGKKKANFHSQYLSFLVESGFFAFLLCLLITFVFPLYYQNNFFPFIAGLFFFNLFYQLNHEPLYWFSIFYYYKYLFEEKKYV